MYDPENNIPLSEDELEIIYAFAGLYLDGQGDRLKELQRCMSENNPNVEINGENL